MQCPLAGSKAQRLIAQTWPLLANNNNHWTVQYAKWCRACQIHADFIHQPSELHHPTVASWPFEAWGIDVI